MTGGAELIVGTVVSVSYGGIFVFASRRGSRDLHAASARGVIAQLSDNPSTAVDVQVHQSTPVWDPGQPLGPRNFLNGPGHARYWQDEDGLIHLDWQPRSGRARHASGPTPELPPLRREPIGRTVKVAGVILATYLLILAGWYGFRAL